MLSMLLFFINKRDFSERAANSDLPLSTTKIIQILKYSNSESIFFVTTLNTCKNLRNVIKYKILKKN